MKRFLPFIIVAAVALVTVGSAAMLYRAKRLPVPPPPTISKEQLVRGESSANPLHVRGPLDAPVTLEEFGDFQCPPCRHLAGPIERLEKEYHPRLRIVYRHFPLANHRHAQAAAQAAEAAAHQGRFWEMHEMLYREQTVWSKAEDVQSLFKTYATLLKLDLDRFSKDMASDETKARVAADQKRGAELGVKNTPTIFINDRMLPATSLNPVALQTEIDAAIKALTPGASAQATQPNQRDSSK